VEFLEDQRDSLADNHVLQQKPFTPFQNEFSFANQAVSSPSKRAIFWKANSERENSFVKYFSQFSSPF
jgi:hypothetical protein